jgi:hypothetical protein
MKLKYVYIASPYTKGDVAVNVRRNIACGEALTFYGLIPFIPLLGHFWHIMFPHDAEFWYELDLQWIHKCDALLRLPGDSTGADKEVNYAKENNIPVFFSVEELLEYNARLV